MQIIESIVFLLKTLNNEIEESNKLQIIWLHNTQTKSVFIYLVKPQQSII